MKKIVAIVTMMVLAVGLVFAKPKRLVEQFTDWELTSVKSFSWNNEVIKQENDIYVPMLGEDYVKYILDGPFDVNYVSDKIAEETLEDTENLDIFSFEGTRSGKRYVVSFIEYEPNKFYMRVYQEVKGE